MSAPRSDLASFTIKAYCLAKSNLAFILLLLTLVLMVSKSLYNVPVSIMAIIGLTRMIRSPRLVFADPLIRVYSVLFLCLWLPLLISLPDAVNVGHSARTVIPYLRFLFMGIYVLLEKDNILVYSRLTAAVFCVAVFWGVDATIQYIFGTNLFGYPYQPGHITGMFYPDNTIAHVLAALSPLYFESVRIYSKKYRWVWLAILPLLVVILLSGRRAAWIMLAISVAGYLFYLFRHTGIGHSARRNLLLIILAGLATTLVVILTSTPLQDRMAVTAGLFSLDYELTDLATARRLPIWETAVEIFRHNWINGVGPRGFRYVYQQYSSNNNFWHETGTTHPHQLLLEVLVETGVIGFVGLALFAWIFCSFFMVKARASSTVFPWILSIFLVMFPFSTNMAFYGSYWASVIWWFLVVAFVSMKTPADKQAS